MAANYKNIIITPNIGNTSDPKIDFLGGNTTANTTINLYVYPDANGTLSFEGSAGQLLSITNDLANLLFSVSDVSGIPSLEVYANGLVSIAPFGGNVVFGNTSELILSPGTGIYANGGLGTAGQVLHSNGTSVYWAADDNAGGTVTAVAASAMDLSLGNFFTKTAAGALTWTFTNVPASRASVVILELTNGGSGTQTWPASVDWPGGTAPTLTAAGVDVLWFFTDDGGTIWRGTILIKDSK